MSDDTVRLSVIGQILRKRWRLLAVTAAAGALLGAGASILLSPGYQTSTSVLLQGTRLPDEMITETQVASSSMVLDRAAGALGWQVSTDDLRGEVTVAVGEGNVIKITATADTAEKARQLADQVAKEYINYSTQLISNTAGASAQLLREQRETLRQQVTDTNQKISDLVKAAAPGLTIESVQTRTELESLRTTLEQAMNKLDAVDSTSGQAKMVIMEPAERPAGRAGLSLPEGAVGGGLVFLILGVFGHLIAARVDRRLRAEPEIAAALGAPVLGAIDIPDGGKRKVAPTSLGGRLRRLVLDDEPWNIPQLQVSSDETSRGIRYRRVLTRLRDRLGDSPLVLVLSPADDADACHAAEELAAVADADTGPSSVALRVVEVTAARPTVPDDPAVTGVLVVLGAGTRTAWELVAITEACADAGHELAGAVVTYRARTAATPAEAAPESSEAMAESA